MAPARLAPLPAGAPSAVPDAPVHALQLGLGWFPERAGGLDRVFFHLAERLPDEGVRCCSIVAAQPTSVAGWPSVQAFAPAEAPLPWRLWRARAALAALERQRFDLVASHFALYTFAVLDRLPEAPLVVHFHGPWAAEARVEGAGPAVYRLKLAIEQRVYGRAQRLIVLSEAFQRLLAERYGIPEDRVEVVPGGVDVARFDVGLSRQEARARLGWPTDRPVVLAVRRLAQRMGLDDLIQSVGFVRQRVPDVLVFLAGTGPLEGELQARIAATGLEAHVRVLGFVPDEALPLAYRAADLSVVPSVALEGFGLVAAESLAAGTPVLVTPVGGLPEVVRDLSEDLVLPSTGSRALAEGLAAALGGPLALPDEATCRDFAGRYDWSAVAARTADVYRSVL